MICLYSANNILFTLIIKYQITKCYPCGKFAYVAPPICIAGFAYVALQSTWWILPMWYDHNFFLNLTKSRNKNNIEVMIIVQIKMS